jgi:putative membrane protein
MSLLAAIAVTLVALLHLYFLVLEMFLWTKPLGLKVFRNTPEFAQASKVLAANQGLYNGFLAAGLLWSLSHGAATVSRKILFVQAVPAAVAMALVLLG